MSEHWVVIVFVARVARPPTCRTTFVADAPAKTADTDKTVDEKVLRQATRQLHVNMGHPPNAQLARAIRVNGGSEQAITMALNWKCEVCAGNAAPGTSLPTKLTRERKFNDAIAVDLFFIRHRRDNPGSFLYIIDLANRYKIIFY